MKQCLGDTHAGASLGAGVDLGVAGAFGAGVGLGVAGAFGAGVGLGVAGALGAGFGLGVAASETVRKIKRLRVTVTTNKIRFLECIFFGCLN